MRFSELSVTIWLLLAIFSFSIFSCEKDLPQKNETISTQNQKSLLDDTDTLQQDSLWAVNYIFNQMKDMDKGHLLGFIREFGQPHWDKKVIKTGEAIDITSVPTIKNGSITGIIRLYQPAGEDMHADFFPVEEIQNAISDDDLETDVFHAYRGAVQALILCAQLNEETINPKFVGWLEHNAERTDEKTEYFCIEIWDCCGCPFEEQGGGCQIVYMECWMDWSPRNFPSNWTGNGGYYNGWPEIGGSGHNFDYQFQKESFLDDWLENNGIDDSFANLFIDCVEALGAPGGGTAAEIFISPNCVEDEIRNSNELFQDLDLSLEKLIRLFSLVTELELNNDEIGWLLEHSTVLAEVQSFLDGVEGTEYDHRILLLQTLLTQPQGSHLTADLLDQIFSFWENHYTDSNGMGVVSDLAQFYLRSQNGDLNMTFEEFEEAYEDWLEGLEENNDPFIPGDIFAIANPIKQELIARYSNNPIALQRINNWFICRVMGIGFQEAVLESLGRGNFELIDASPDGLNRRPDGYHTNSIQYAYFPFFSVGVTHTITEVKGVFSGTMPFNFTYQNQMGQLNDYLEFLNENQYEGQFPNSLQLIVPGGVSIDQGIISRCTGKNVQLSTAVIEGHPNNPDLVRVSPFSYRNHHDLQYHPDQNETLIMNVLDGVNFFELGKSFHGGSDYVNIREHLQAAADDFEASHLQGNSNEGCPVD